MNEIFSEGNKMVRTEKELFPIIVMGGSAGSFNALVTLLDTFPHELKAAILVVLHLSPTSNVSFIVQHLQQHTSLRCKFASDGEILESGTLYFALPQKHLLVSENKIILGNGADENRFKPSIDVLFRAAAVHLRERVIGIIFSGFLDDGVSGMAAIKSCGGVCIVQDPADAANADLPIAVITAVDPHYSLPAERMYEAILSSTQTERKKVTNIPQELIEESRIAEKALSNIDQTRKLGTQSLFTCPECGGSLWHITENGISRYRCFTGHAYSELNLMEKQNESLLLTLWTALRMFEERKKLLQKVPQTFNIDRRQQELEKHISTLKVLLTDIQKIVQ